VTRGKRLHSDGKEKKERQNRRGRRKDARKGDERTVSGNLGLKMA